MDQHHQEDESSHCYQRVPLHQLEQHNAKPTTQRMKQPKQHSTTPRLRRASAATVFDSNRSSNTMQPVSSSSSSHLPLLFASASHHHSPQHRKFRSTTKRWQYSLHKRWMLWGMAALTVLSGGYNLHWMHANMMMGYYYSGSRNSAPNYRRTALHVLDPWTLHVLPSDSQRYPTERRRRLQPPPSSSVWNMSSSAAQLKGLQLDHATTETTSLDTLFPNPTEYDWPTLCRNAGLLHDKKKRGPPRIVITHGLSGPVPYLPLALARYCRIQPHVTLADPLLPNLRHTRRLAMGLYQRILRSLEHVSLVVPTYATGWKSQTDAANAVLPKWLQQTSKTQPTHIIHLEPASPEDYLPEHLDDYMGRSSQRLYFQHHGQVGWEQLMDTATAAAANTNQKQTTRLLRVQFGATNEFPLAETTVRVLQQRQQKLSFHAVELAYHPWSTVTSSSNHTTTTMMDDTIATILLALAPSSPTFLRVEGRRNSSVEVATVESNATTTIDPMTYYQAHSVALPCASGCAATDTCQASIWDTVIPISQRATKQCVYVVYMADLDASVSKLYPTPQQPKPLVCRVAFIAGTSPLAQSLIQAGHENGKWQSQGWTVVWLPDTDESKLSDAAVALPRLEPTKLFYPTVRKAMYVGAAIYAKPPDTALLHILSSLDQRALPPHAVKEVRSGTKLGRWVPRPARNARSVTLLASEPPPPYRPASVNAYAALAANASVHVPARQIQFYNQASHYIQMDVHRPEDEMRRTLYNPFPFQWITTTGLLIHDVRAASALRCAWLHESVYWGSNRGADELSLAYVLAEARIAGGVGPEDEEDEGWMPLPMDASSGSSKKRGVVDPFFRILKTSG